MIKKQLHIDKEAVATLGLLQDGLLYPAIKLMGKKESKEVDKTKKYNNITYPFSFILAPSGKRNESILKSAKKDETLDLVCNKEICGKITVAEIFKIDKKQRIQTIYGTQNLEHPGVNDTNRRLGNYAISGLFVVNFKDTTCYKQKIIKIIKKTGAKKISSMVISGKPFHKIHETLIRNTLAKCDLMILLVRKPYNNDTLPYDIRKKTIEYFCNNYLPKNKIIIIPLDNTYIFGGFNELILNAIVAKNFGSNKLVVGQNQTGLGAFYYNRNLISVVDTIKDIGIDIDIIGEFAYCDKCNTIVNIDTCPHGQHHHIHYHSPSIMGLLEMGIIPPSIFIRKEISSIILSNLFPKRKQKINQIQQRLLPSSSLLDDFSSKDFYESLMSLYQISSFD